MSSGTLFCDENLLLFTFLTGKLRKFLFIRLFIYYHNKVSSQNQNHEKVFRRITNLALTELKMAEIDFENVFPVLCKMVVLVLHCFSFLKTELPSPRDSRKPPRLVAFPSSSSAPLIRVLLWAIILARIAASFSLSNLSDKSLKLLLFMESWAF